MPIFVFLLKAFFSVRNLRKCIKIEGNQVFFLHFKRYTKIEENVKKRCPPHPSDRATTDVLAPHHILPTKLAVSVLPPTLEEAAASAGSVHLVVI